MSDQPITAAAIMSAVQRLEDASATFYDGLAAAYPAHAKQFQGYAKDCEKHRAQLLRTYQETVTDALETNYSFEGLSLAAADVESSVPLGALGKALVAAVALERTAIAFYTQVAEASESLLATIPRAFSRVAKRRERRVSEMAALDA